jgi:hypothetical protein
MRWLAGLLALTACNQLLGIDRTQPIDAGTTPDAPDGDNDSVADELDNCPLVSNGMQSDIDKDAIGDACDNCPLIPNPLQQHGGDTDEIGDACDPNPQSNSDCLLLFDSFANPAELMTHWSVEPPQYAASVTASSGMVTLPNAAVRVALFSKEITSIGTAIQLLGTKENRDSEAGIALQTSADLKLGFHCWEVFDGTRASPTLVAQIATDVPESNLLSTNPVNPDLVLRLAVPASPLQGTTLRCRVDYGVAVGVMAAYSPVGVARGPLTGAFTLAGLFEIHAVAIYGVAPCPPPIVR